MNHTNHSECSEDALLWILREKYEGSFRLIYYTEHSFVCCFCIATEACGIVHNNHTSLIPSTSAMFSHVFNLSQEINLQKIAGMHVYQNCWLTGSHLFFYALTSTHHSQVTKQKRQSISLLLRNSSYLILLIVMKNREFFHYSHLHVSNNYLQIQLLGILIVFITVCQRPRVLKCFLNNNQVLITLWVHFPFKQCNYSEVC